MSREEYKKWKTKVKQMQENLIKEERKLKQNLERMKAEKKKFSTKIQKLEQENNDLFLRLRELNTQRNINQANKAFESKNKTSSLFYFQQIYSQKFLAFFSQNLKMNVGRGMIG